MSQQQQILKDFQKVRRAKGFFDDARIVANFERGDISDFRIFILPVHGFFRNCLVRFSMKFDDYPNKKPSPKCLTRIYHPNVSGDGSICYSMFGNDWKSEFKLLDYVNAQPNHGDPLNSSCVQQDSKKYDELVQKGANGAKLGGHEYDYCVIKHSFQDSKDFEKNLKPLIFFLDQKKITSEIDRKIKELEAKIGQLEQTKKELHVKFVMCIQNVNLALSELSKHGSIENFEDFKSEDFDKAKGICEGYYQRVNDVYNLEMKVEKVWTSVKDAHPPVGGDRTFPIFEKAFQPLRETCDKVSSLLQMYFEKLRCIEQPEEEGEQEEDPEKKKKEEEEEKDPKKVLEKLNETISSVNIFLEKCDQLLECEKKVVVHKKRVGNNAEFSIEIIALQFIPFDFEIMDNLLQKLYGDLNMDKDCKKIFEGMKLVLDVRRNSKEIYELELLVMKEMTILKNLHDKDGSPQEWIRKLLYANLMNEFDKSTRQILDSLHPIVSEDQSKVDPELEKVKLMIVQTKQNIIKAKVDAERIIKVDEKLKSFFENISKRAVTAASIFSAREDEEKGNEIISRFEKVFFPVREFWKKRETFTNDVNISKFCSQVYKLFENSDQVFDLELKLLNFLKILKSRLGSGREDVFERFKKTDLEKFMLRQRDEIYEEYLNLEKSDEEENSVKLIEKVKRVKEILRNSEKILEKELEFVQTKNSIDIYRERHLWVEQEIIPLFDPFKTEGRKILDELHEQVNLDPPKFDELCQKIVPICQKAESDLKGMKKDFESQIRKHFQELLAVEVKLMVFFEKLGRKFPKKKGRVFQNFDRAFQQTREAREEMKKCFAKEKFVKDDDEEVEGEEEEDNKNGKKKQQQQKKKGKNEEEEKKKTESTMKREEMKKLCDRTIPFLCKCEKILDLEIKNQELMGRTRNTFLKRDHGVYLNFSKNGFLTLIELTNKLYDPRILNLEKDDDQELERKVNEIHTFRMEKLEKLFKFELEISKDLTAKNRRLERDYKNKNEIFEVQRKEIQLLLKEFHMSTYFVVFEKKEKQKKGNENENDSFEEKVEKLMDEMKKKMEEFRLTQKKIKELVLEKKRKVKLKKRLKKLRRRRTGGRRRRGGGVSLLESVFEEEDI